MAEQAETSQVEMDRLKEELEASNERTIREVRNRIRELTARLGAGSLEPEKGAILRELNERADKKMRDAWTSYLLEEVKKGIHPLSEEIQKSLQKLEADLPNDPQAKTIVFGFRLYTYLLDQRHTGPIARQVKEDLERQMSSVQGALKELLEFFCEKAKEKLKKEWMAYFSQPWRDLPALAANAKRALEEFPGDADLTLIKRQIDVEEVRVIERNPTQGPKSALGKLSALKEDQLWQDASSQAVLKNLEQDLFAHLKRQWIGYFNQVLQGAITPELRQGLAKAMTDFPGDPDICSVEIEVNRRLEMMKKGRIEYVNKLISDKNFDTAENSLEKALGEFPKDEELLALREKLREGKAADTLEKERINNHVARIYAYIGQKKWSSAKSQLEEFKKQFPDNVTISIFEQALASAEQAPEEKIKPKRPVPPPKPAPQIAKPAAPRSPVVPPPIPQKYLKPTTPPATPPDLKKGEPKAASDQKPQPVQPSAKPAITSPDSIAQQAPNSRAITELEEMGKMKARDLSNRIAVIGDIYWEHMDDGDTPFEWEDRGTWTAEGMGDFLKDAISLMFNKKLEWANIQRTNDLRKSLNRLKELIAKMKENEEAYENFDWDDKHYFVHWTVSELEKCAEAWQEILEKRRAKILEQTARKMNEEIQTGMQACDEWKEDLEKAFGNVEKVIEQGKGYFKLEARIQNLERLKADPEYSFPGVNFVKGWPNEKIDLLIQFIELTRIKRQINRLTEKVGQDKKDQRPHSASSSAQTEPVKVDQASDRSAVEVKHIKEKTLKAALEEELEKLKGQGQSEEGNRLIWQTFEDWQSKLRQSVDKGINELVPFIENLRIGQVEELTSLNNKQANILIKYLERLKRKAEELLTSLE